MSLHTCLHQEPPEPVMPPPPPPHVPEGDPPIGDPLPPGQGRPVSDPPADPNQPVPRAG